jgi:probable HAF family extracellular repeat protein
MRQLALGAAALALLAASTAAGAQSYTFSFLDGLGGSYSVANGINNAGQVVGFSYTTGNSTHATLWNGITPTALGGTDSVAFAINNAGQVVGYSGNHATIWNGTTPTALDGLSGGFSIAAAINNDGQVVGESQTTPGGAVHAILWNGTTPIDLNKYLDSNLANAGWFLSSANGINDIGSIVGQARTRPDGESRAYILSVTAVPEPQTYALMLAGLGMVCFATLRRKPANA